MKKYNFISLGYHGIIAVVSLTILPILFINTNKGCPNTKLFSSIIYMLLPILFYIIAGSTFKPTKSIANDFLSFIFVGIIGILIWLICFSKSPNNFNMKDSVGGAWFVYYIYISGTGYIDSFIRDQVSVNNKIVPYLLLLHSILPTIMFFIGLEIKRVYLKIFIY